MSWQDKTTCTHWNSQMICCGNYATAFGPAPNSVLSPQALRTVNPSQTLLSSNFTCYSPKITSPLLWGLTFARQQPQDSHLPLCVASTSSTDLTYFKLSYTLFISPPTSPCINCVCFPSLPLTASQRWEQQRHYYYHHPLPPSIPSSEIWGHQPSPPSLCWGQAHSFRRLSSVSDKDSVMQTV